MFDIDSPNESITSNMDSYGRQPSNLDDSESYAESVTTFVSEGSGLGNGGKAYSTSGRSLAEEANYDETDSLRTPARFS